MFGGGSIFNQNQGGGSLFGNNPSKSFNKSDQPQTNPTPGGIFGGQPTQGGGLFGNQQTSK
jgi:hypothetical protein